MRISDWSSDVCSSDLAKGVTIAVVGSARLHRRAEGIELQLGAATFGVDPRGPDAEPRRIVVSQGTIEIMGTNFTVERSEERRVGKECVSTCRLRWSTDP